jgi:hypothetical protein
MLMISSGSTAAAERISDMSALSICNTANPLVLAGTVMNVVASSAHLYCNLGNDAVRHDDDLLRVALLTTDYRAALAQPPSTVGCHCAIRAQVEVS